jgi:hypothetical protein
MNDLRKYFDNNKDRLIHKWEHYFEIYDRHFSAYRNKEIVVLEIGVFEGGSLQMWKNYFGPKAKIYGIDIDPKCKEYEEENIEIFIGSQSDKEFLSDIKSKIPKIDILLDDGGHTMHQIKTSFLELFDHVKEDGIYAIEDLHTCYWLEEAINEEAALMNLVKTWWTHFMPGIPSKVFLKWINIQRQYFLCIITIV